MNEAVLDVVTALWAEHLGAPWPEELYRVDDRDGDVVEIDGAMAGCISAYVQGRGALDAKRSRILQACARDLQKILPRLRGEGAQHIRRLIRMAELIRPDAVHRPADGSAQAAPPAGTPPKARQEPVAR